MSSLRFYDLNVKRVNPEAAGSVAITFEIPSDLHEIFSFEPGQFLTLRSTVDGEDLRRNYSISSPRSRLTNKGELEIGIRPVEDGHFSNWVTANIQAGDRLSVMPPDGRFTVKKQRAIHRVGFACGSGITPVLSIATTTLEEQPESKFTLIYGNRRMASVMFNESLQDLKDRFADRFTMVHILSRQAQEVELLEGRINEDKVHALIDAFLPVASMDEVFICGPESMIDTVEKTLVTAGVPASRVYTERFTMSLVQAAKVQADTDTAEQRENLAKEISLTVLVDGHEQQLQMGAHEKVLDAGLNAGLDLPFSCKSGVCCTCRCKVIEGSVAMDKNYTLEPSEVEQGFILSCQARAISDKLVVSFDER